MIKKILSCILIINLNAYSQAWEKELLKSNPSASIHEKQESFKAYRKDNLYTKGNGFKPYARSLDFILRRSSENTSFTPHALYEEWLLQKRKSSLANNTNSANWIAKGPINTPIILSNGKKRGNGRVNCIAFDPFNQNIIWVGSPSGGLWKSEDGGSNWTTNTDNLPVIGVSSIVIHPVNPQIMYIVTGDAFGSDTYSIGVLKSIDGGQNWQTTGLSYNISQENRINKIILNPNFPDSIFAATNSNIKISVDGGANWTNVTSQNGLSMMGRWRDLEFKPNDPSTIYAAKQISSGGSSIFRSEDGGVTWAVTNNGMNSPAKDRPLLAVTNDNPNVVYALFSSTDDSFHGLYKSNDSGDNWALQSNSPNILGRNVDGTSSGGQSWYDLSLGVSPIDENLIYVGGINLWKSSDGGVNWNVDGSSGNNQQLYSYMHVDQHALEFNPLNNIAYAGNDGGIYKYVENLNNWVDISDGLEISQFYKLGLSRSNQNKLVAGAQDNGTEMLTNNVWDAIRGSDGMECAFDQFDEDVIYSSSQYGGLKKSFNGGLNWTNIKPVTYDGAWVTPYKIHPENNNLIVIGYDEIYRSITAGTTWDSVSYNVSNGQPVRTIALAPSNQNYIYAATYTRLKVTTDGGATWTAINFGLPVQQANITDVVVANNNPDRLWVTFSGYNSNEKVYESNDRGANWINITSSGLPNLPVNCIVYQKLTNDDLYVGTDIGVYYRDKTMNEWVPYMNGMPNVIISELEIHYDKETISAATFGRGVWESPINTSPYISHSLDRIYNDNFDLYPNPCGDNLNVYSDSNTEPRSITIYSLTGKKVLFNKPKPNSNKIDVSNLSSGKYIVEISTSNDYYIRKKLIIK